MTTPHVPSPSLHQAAELIKNHVVQPEIDHCECCWCGHCGGHCGRGSTGPIIWDATHVMNVLRLEGFAIVSAKWASDMVERTIMLERKNENLGRLANCGAPRGYSLVKTEEVEPS